MWWVRSGGNTQCSQCGWSTQSRRLKGRAARSTTQLCVQGSKEDNVNGWSRRSGAITSLPLGHAPSWCNKLKNLWEPRASLGFTGHLKGLQISLCYFEWLQVTGRLLKIKAGETIPHLISFYLIDLFVGLFNNNFKIWNCFITFR